MSGRSYAIGSSAVAVCALIAWVLLAPKAGRNDGGHKKLGFDVLSGFKYDTYEVINDVDGGRPFTRSDDEIPPEIRAYNGTLVAITGFVMPLRVRKGLVTEFLLFKDQASCCFGERARMNHYIRVKLTGDGFPPQGTPTTYTAYGRLKVGEILVQGYLTGIYELEASKVVKTSQGT